LLGTQANRPVLDREVILMAQKPQQMSREDLMAAKRQELEEAARREGTSFDQIIREAIMIKRWLEDGGGDGAPQSKSTPALIPA
jgi:2-C-methyl-D-erythritol 4-phosphate cytidylyltransferase